MDVTELKDEGLMDGESETCLVRTGREHGAREPERSGVWLMLSRNPESFRIPLKSVLAAFCQPLPSVFLMCLLTRITRSALRSLEITTMASTCKLSS